jgi:hypothetical protein
MRNPRTSQEGYLLIDHRASPGVPQELLRSLGIDAPGISEGQIYETRSLHCTHCGGCVVVNMDRTRERGHCPSCDHYICDLCAAQYRLDSRCIVYEERALGVLRKTLVGPSWSAYNPHGTTQMGGVVND